MSPGSRIQVLPPELASQIAAGEVVERPASATKELIENALDAEATRVDVEVEAGGIGRILVRDDGLGMPEEDAALCLERHATSKLRSLADLGCVQSFGFRGEALPSIASVSRLRLRTRARGAEAGLEICIAAGATPERRPVGMSEGTQVEVRDLFFNVPARRKFLRSSGTEAGHISEVLENAALARPEVTFTLTRDGRRVREFLRTSNREERVRQVHELDLAPCRGERGPLRVEAFLGRPEAARTGASGLHLLVNGRPVRDRSLLVTVAQAYGSVLERGRYPLGVIYLELPAELVDVNVHPQKAEVRFADPRALTDAVYSVLGRALAQAFSLPTPTRAAWGRAERASDAPKTGAEAARSAPEREITSAPGTPAAERRSERPPAPPGPLHPLFERRSDLRFEQDAGERTSPREELERDDKPVDRKYVPAPAPDPVLLARDGHGEIAQLPGEPRWSTLGFVAQLRQTFLLCEGAFGVYLLDQHAAAERVTFARLRREYQSRAVAQQALLFPVTVDVTSLEAELLEEHAEQVQQVGLDVRLRGAGTASIHGVPKLLQRASPERLLRDLLGETSRKAGRAFSDTVDLALATMACHGSLRAGDGITTEEVKALLVSLDSAEFAGHCPHGRPIVTFLSWAELERKVGRR